jgi:hypothetical protein
MQKRFCGDEIEKDFAYCRFRGARRNAGFGGRHCGQGGAGSIRAGLELDGVLSRRQSWWRLGQIRLV